MEMIKEICGILWFMFLGIVAIYFIISILLIHFKERKKAKRREEINKTIDEALESLINEISKENKTEKTKNPQKTKQTKENAKK